MQGPGGEGWAGAAPWAPVLGGRASEGHGDVTAWLVWLGDICTKGRRSVPRVTVTTQMLVTATAGPPAGPGSLVSYGTFRGLWTAVDKLLFVE